MVFFEAFEQGQKIFVKYYSKYPTFLVISTLLLCSVSHENSKLHIYGFSDFPETWCMIFAVASRVCAAGSYYACLQFASELFPTEIRGKGSSAFEISGGVGLFIQPQINYLVNKFRLS